jgi:hypothetical protein
MNSEAPAAPSPAVDLDEGMRRCEEWLRAEGLLPPRRPPAAPR